MVIVVFLNSKISTSQKMYFYVTSVQSSKLLLNHIYKEIYNSQVKVALKVELLNKNFFYILQINDILMI